MCRCILYIRLIVLVIFFTLISNYAKVSAYVPTVEGKNILVIGSYSFQNEWEESVLSGFKIILGDKNNIKSYNLYKTYFSINYRIFYRIVAFY